MSGFVARPNLSKSSLALLSLLLLTLVTPKLSSPSITLAQDILTTPISGLPQCGAGESGTTYFTLAAVGDLLLHYNIQTTANSLGYDYLFDKVRPYLQAADLTYANFEGVIAPGQESGEFPTFAYNPHFATAVKNSGIDVVSTANNHAIDRGPASVDSTINFLDEAGLLHHGTTARDQTPIPYLPLEFTAKNGNKLKAAFLSFTFSTNGIPDPYNQVNMLWDGNGRIRQSVKEAVAQAHRETDLVIAAIHWGDEYQFYPNAAQRQGARDLAEAGVDILLGDHPHTIEPTEILDTAGRKTLVIYSLGNFIAAQEAFQSQNYTQTALIYYVGIVKSPNSHATVTGYQYLPVYIENDTRPTPILPGQYSAARSHVLEQMRDPTGYFALDPNAKLKELCPFYNFKEAPEIELAGDFALYFQTLGQGYISHPLPESVALIGFPTSPVREELAGDCSHKVKVIYTERQRLEWQPEANWPYRVVGTQLGAEVYFRKYDLPLPNSEAIPRRTDLSGDAIVDPRFKEFFNAYGGLSVFGYPLSSDLYEIDPVTRKSKLVQYFERARFELVQDAPEDPNPLYRVQLGLLSEEYPGVEAVCEARQKSTKEAGRKEQGARKKKF